MYTNIAVIITITETTRIPMTVESEGRIYVIQKIVGFGIGCCITTVVVAALAAAAFKTDNSVSVVLTFPLTALVTAVLLVDTDSEIAVQN